MSNADDTYRVMHPEREAFDALIAAYGNMIYAEISHKILWSDGPDDVVDAPALGIVRQPRNAAWSQRSELSAPLGR